MQTESARGEGAGKGPDDPAPAPNAAGGAPEWDSRDLLADGREAIIRHGAHSYRLQLTGSNKLILTK